MNVDSDDKALPTSQPIRPHLFHSSSWESSPSPLRHPLLKVKAKAPCCPDRAWSQLTAATLNMAEIGRRLIPVELIRTILQHADEGYDTVGVGNMPSAGLSRASKVLVAINAS
ncbi:hypothetical protein IFR05_016566, partial [Cadophora sp. M221]